MFQALAEVEPRPPYAIIDDGRRVDTLELNTLTAIVLEVYRYGNDRYGARLNAYVDGVGHRTVLVELTLEGYHQAAACLHRHDVLVRCSGMLVDEGPHPHLLALDGLQLLLPDDPVQ